MHANVHPRNQIRLRNVFSIEEVMEIYRRFSRKVHIPDSARRGLSFFTMRHRQVISSPISIVEESLRAHNRLYIFVRQLTTERDGYY